MKRSASPAYRWLLRIGVGVLATIVVGALLVGGIVACSHQTLRPDVDPASLTPSADMAPWSGLLAESVRDGRVDYAQMRARRADLERWVATIAITGPNTTPELFPTLESRFAWYLNVYNLLVVYGVVATEVHETIHEVRVPFVPVPGYGFFYSLRFVVDGERMSLYTLEHEVIRAQFADARLHAALNCASISCPPLLAEAYDPDKLDAQLAGVAQFFASTPPHVAVDPAARVVRLSSIYTWYQADFEAHARALGVGTSVLDWIIAHADTNARPALETARTDGYALEFVPYDWGLNTLPSPATP